MPLMAFNDSPVVSGYSNDVTSPTSQSELKPPRTRLGCGGGSPARIYKVQLLGFLFAGFINTLKRVNVFKFAAL